MSKRALIIASFLALALAITAIVLVRTSLLTATNDSIVLALDFVAGGIAGRVILGRRRPFRYLTLGIVVFSAFAAGFMTTAVTNYLVRHAVVIGSVALAPSKSEVTDAIVAGVLYLIAATLYGFAGTKLGVGIVGRIGLLLLLLLALIPGASVIGTLGFALLAFVRRPWATPARPAASE